MLAEKINADFIPVNQESEPEKWAEIRTNGIGGSDAGAIMGMNRFSSPLTVYMQKKGIEGFGGNKSTEWGHILEDPIRQKAAKELNCTIETVNGTYKSRENPFMQANLDGLIYTENGITLNGDTVTGLGGHEIKTSATGEGFSANEIPDSYYCQVQHYMSVTGLDWFILTVFFLNTKTGAHYIVRRNDEFIELLIQKEAEFWNDYVLAEKMPEPTGADSEKDYIEKLPIDSVVNLDEEAQSLIEEELNIENQLKELSKRQSELKNSILMKIAENSSGFEDADKTTATVGTYKVTYNKQIRKSLDADAIKAAGLFDKFSKESSFKVLRISGGK